MVQPSSSFASALPPPVGIQLATPPVSVRMASCAVQQLASIIFPLGRTMLCASPTVDQPAGAVSGVHLLVFGLYSDPRVVHTDVQPLYSPPMIATCPEGSTWDAK